MEKDKFRDKCIEMMGDEAEYYLPLIDDYVFSVAKARELAEELVDEGATVKIAPRLKGKPDSEHSNPKVRMWALYREQANKLGTLLGLIPGKKVGRPSKEKAGFNLTEPMKIAK